MHSALRHGRHSDSPLTPLHECPHPKSLAQNWNGFESSSTAAAAASVGFFAAIIYLIFVLFEILY